MKTMRCKKLSVLKIIAHVGFDENWREGVFEITSMEGFLRLMSELHDGDSNVDSINNHDSNYIIDGDDNQHHRSNITGPNALVSEMDQSRQN